MLSGSRPRGSSSAPVSGNTGKVGERSSGRGCRWPMSGDSAEQEGRELAAGGGGGGVAEAPCLEKLQQLQARRFLVPGAVAAADVQQGVGGFLAAFHGDQRGGQVVANLEVGGVGGQALLECAELITGRAALGGQGEGAAGAGHLGVVGDLGWHLGERLVGLVFLAKRHQ